MPTSGSNLTPGTAPLACLPKKSAIVAGLKCQIGTASGEIFESPPIWIKSFLAGWGLHNLQLREDKETLTIQYSG